MSEKTLASYVRKGLRPFGRTKRIENRVDKGTPDLFYVISGPPAMGGWIELKDLPQWPKRPETIVRISHFSQEQRLWLKEMGQSGCPCWLLLRVQKDYLLFDWRAAYHWVGHLPRVELEDQAVMTWSGRIDWKQMGALLAITI